MKKLLVIIILLASFVTRAQSPEYAIVLTDGSWHQYNCSMYNAHFSTFLEQHDNIWTLKIEAFDSIQKILFPWEKERHPLDEDISDDIFYYPFLAGVTEKATHRNLNWTWWGLSYPGEAFAPFVIAADADNGRIVAAVNDPPRKVTPMYAAERIMMSYVDVLLGRHDTIFLAALIDSVQADTANGEKAWQLAADKYREWLSERMPPVEYPEPLQNLHGWVHYGLMNGTSFNYERLSNFWRFWRNDLGWLQCWGQMSNYAGDPNLAVPPLLPGEETGCCLLKPEMHTRYLPTMPEFMRDSVTALGYQGSYYSAPHYANPRLNMDTEEGQAWLQNWIDTNSNVYHANAHYIDVLGRSYFGDPVVVTQLFNGNLIPEMSVIEGMVDIYPAAGLLSGSLKGAGAFIGGPDSLPENSQTTTFPQLQRYLLNERAVFLGQSNGDHIFWGPDNNYWAERQAFLLGAKFDAATPYQDGSLYIPNTALRLAIDLRNACNWWQRKPVYLDTWHITQIPEGIDVRHFSDSADTDIFVIDNWNQLTGTSFKYEDKSFNIPEDLLSIIIDSIPTVPVPVHQRKRLNFEVYPNPAKDYFTVILPEKVSFARLSVLDMLGHKISEHPLENGTSFTFPIGMLSQGVYFLKLEIKNNNAVMQKIIINK